MYPKDNLFQVNSQRMEIQTISKACKRSVSKENTWAKIGENKQLSAQIIAVPASPSIHQKKKMRHSIMTNYYGLELKENKALKHLYLASYYS